VADAAALNPGGGLTIVAWVRPSLLPTTRSAIVRKGSQYMVRLTSAGAISFSLWKGGVATELVTPPGAVSAGRWTDVVATWNGSTMAVYANGAQQATAPFSGPLDTSANGVYLGSSWASYDWFAGRLDEVAVYGSALAAARVQAHYAVANLSDP